MKAWEIVSDGGIDALHLAERPEPEPGHGEVKIRVRANTINYRDLSTILDPVARNIPYPQIANSDCAGEIVSAGPGVTGFSAGDRVMGQLVQTWLDGSISARDMANSLGGTLDGVLAEYVVLPATGIVRVPSHMTYEQAATLPCAALTAWNCLIAQCRILPGQDVLFLGTGGVSIFGLQIAKMAGARAIVTSSDDAKLERARALGADETVNYRKHPDWENAVLDLTGGRGVDASIEVGGGLTLPKTIAATRVGGSIALIGVLTKGEIDPTAIMRKSIHLYGVYCGSRRMFEEMVSAFEVARVEPEIHQVLDFEDAQQAYRTMLAASHIGKIVIRV